MGLVSPKLVFVLVFVINVVLLTQSIRGNSVSQENYGHGSLVKRIIEDWNTVPVDSLQTQCKPLAYPVTDQCSHVQEQCHSSNTFIGLQYLRNYFCSDTSLRPAVFIGLLVWLLFLFSTLGISASDFFTPNLATLASILGLDENVAGVTFLAFGNGSPDVFSTFSAMRAGSGSLAIGELVGAASFIVSCVVGSMCIIKPFAIHRAPFLRDVGFFTVAVVMLFAALWDNKISLWESLVLLSLYVVYVVVVIVGSWWSRRQERIRLDDQLVRSEYQDDDSATFSTPYRDDPEAPSLHLEIPSRARTRAFSNPPAPSSPSSLRPRTLSHSFHAETTPHLPSMPSFSLVGALEFRHVVSSLQQDATGHSLSAFESPITPYAGGHYHNHRPRSVHRTPRANSHEQNPFDTAMGVQLNERSLRPTPSATTLSIEPGTITPDQHSPRSPDSLLIHEVGHERPDSPSSIETGSHGLAPVSKRQRILHVIRRTVHVLFPSLHNFRDKSFLGQVASLFAAPAIMLLTVTLPVVITPYNGPAISPEKLHDDASGRLIEFEEEGEARALIAEVEEAEHEMTFNKWLMAVQCALGPLFCAAVLAAGTKYFMWIMIAVGITGIALATLVVTFSEKGNHSASIMARTFMGFIVAVVWIMAIADEVVQVLQTFGFIFGLSDAIIGLTIFAVGNSLADLVANMSVAVFAPIMGFAACFGGPMLNILIGIGGSGLYIVSHTQQPYDLHFTTTLLVSTIGLLFLLATTMIFVPFNGYFLTRKWGFFLVFCYIAIMIVNVVVELKT